MEPNVSQERQQAHALLDMPPPEKLNAVRSLLEVMVEPLARALAWPRWNPRRSRPGRLRRSTALVLHWLVARAPAR